MAKYYLFTTALEQGFVWLVLIALAGSMISVAYYFKPIMAMYLREGEAVKMESSLFYRTGLVLITLLVLLVGVLPFLLINLL